MTIWATARKRLIGSCGWLMSKRNRIKADSLASLMSFILGHRPDEFGLVPDAEEHIAFKELLRAIHEEPGWAYVRQSHITEVLVGKGRSLFEWDENRIRALDRRWTLDSENPGIEVPKILYACVRRRAHAHVMEQGLKSDTLLALTSDRDMAMRIGRRKDPNPVLLEITTEPARQLGIPFYPFGELFLAREVPPRFISGPPVHEDARETKQSQKKKGGKPVPALPDFLAGTFALDAHRDPDRSRRLKGKKQRGWKEDAREMRRGKK
jgi:putative RNA 2'-phosphotransferase